MRIPGYVARCFDAERDLDDVFALYCDPATQPLFSERVPITSRAEFADWLDDNLREAWHDVRVLRAAQGGAECARAAAGASVGTSTDAQPASPPVAGAGDTGPREAADERQPAEGELAGLLFSYGYHPFDLHCKLCLCMTPTFRRTGLAAVAGAAFMGELFAAYPLRKIYALVYDYNAESLESNLRAGFEEEGVLREHRFWAGAFHDCHVLAMTRARYEERLAPLVARLAAQA